MKKTLLQMTLTCMIFGVIFAANNAVIRQDVTETHAVSAVFAPGGSD